MKTIFYFFIFIAMISCSKDSDTNESVYANVQNQLYIQYINAKGENLFDSSTSGHFKINEVKLFYIVNNVPVEVNLNNGYNMGSVEISQSMPLRLIIFSNFNPKNGGILISENGSSKIYEFNLLLKLSETETDSIKTNLEYVIENGSTNVTVKKVWYNDRLVADNYLSYFDIIK